MRAKYLGLDLPSPIIVSSSPYTSNVKSVEQCAASGAGAVVLKSIFEEQILHHAAALDTVSDSAYGDAEVYLQRYLGEDYKAGFLRLVQEARSKTELPVIASINCYSDSEWTDFARLMEEAGADALELNILSLQTSKDYTPGSFEQRHIDILRHIKKVVRIPVIMKLGSNLTNPVALINQLYANGAAAVVLFNRFYQPDIQIDNLTFTTANVMSSPSELSDRIRWTAIASAEVPQLDYAVSGGVHNGKGVIKSLLSGAAAVEVCSVIYQHGNQMIEEMKKELAEWMDDKGYDSIAQFKGKMNASAAGDINPFERTQFMKYYSNHEE